MTFINFNICNLTREVIMYIYENLLKTNTMRELEIRYIGCDTCM